MKPRDPPSPTYAFGYKNPPTPGNVINGLGRRDKIRPTRVFHRGTAEPLEWEAMDRFMNYHNVWGVVRHILANTWQLRRRDGPVGRPRVAVEDPQAMAVEIKAHARSLGARLVGITRVTDSALYDGVQVPYETAICLGLPMKREEMVHVPHKRAAVEVMRAYREVARIAIRLGASIRRLGWPAKAYGNPNSTDLLHIPLAIEAGLGQLGKHGSLISKEYGSNIRLAAVLTNLPLAVDRPVDIGVDDLCVTCRRCVIDCPPQALVNGKQMVRGEHKWYVDFDKCLPYFVKTYGCAICIEVCPWSEPGRGPGLSERLRDRRTVHPVSETGR